MANDFHPFDKVLVRDHTDEAWSPALFHYASTDPLFAEHPYMMITGGCWRLCIPYKGNEKEICGDGDACTCAATPERHKALKIFTDRCQKRPRPRKGNAIVSNTEIAELFFDLAVLFIEDSSVPDAAKAAGISEKALRAFIGKLAGATAGSAAAPSEDMW
jgi:hypothetical protein